MRYSRPYYRRTNRENAGLGFLIVFALLVPALFLGYVVAAINTQCLRYAAEGWWIYRGFGFTCGDWLDLRVLSRHATEEHIMNGIRLVGYGLVMPVVLGFIAGALYRLSLAIGAGLVLAVCQVRLTPWPNFDAVVLPVIGAVLHYRAMCRLTPWMIRRGWFHQWERFHLFGPTFGKIVGVLLFLFFGGPFLFFTALVGVHRFIEWLFL